MSNTGVDDFYENYRKTNKVKVEIDVEIIISKEGLKTFAKRNYLKEDWHEPDEEGITATVVGKYFDNADVDGSYDYALLFFKEGRPMAIVNLALLCAWASGYEGQIN